MGWVARVGLHQGGDRISVGSERGFGIYRQHWICVCEVAALQIWACGRTRLDVNGVGWTMDLANRYFSSSFLGFLQRKGRNA
ncbi:hypothetical protein L484_011895 [Morus notabilis]|uniref:Uncharacterized protein n=1 Tax=Morus notabilis TaxID=981085 RepID=W9RRY9_9ROSA|nr:hypothetical protein L484_011895 [Morus notabilis]